MGVVEGDPLGHHAAHGATDDMGAVDAQDVKEAYRVVGEVVESIRRINFGTHQGASDGLANIWTPKAIEPCRCADVSIVESNDLKTLRFQRVNERSGPPLMLSR